MTTTTQSTLASVQAPIPTTASNSTPAIAASPTGLSTPTTQFVPNLVYEWVQRNWDFALIVAARDGIRSTMDNGEPGLSDALDQCVSVASDLAARSSTDAVIADQTRVLADVAATCSSMAAAVASGDTVALTDGRVVFESQFEGLADLVDAFEELMYHGDSNEPVDSIADQ